MSDLPSAYAQRLSFRLPWFMYDLYNRQLITSPVIPGDITDNKSIVLAEQPVPGLNYAPVSPAGGGNRKVSFTLKLIRTNNAVGNLGILKQMDRLRNQAVRPGEIKSGQFTPTPKVLYYWGIGSMPLVWWVSKCDFVHKQGWVNPLGYPKNTDVSIELVLDEQNDLYRVEEAFRQISSRVAERTEGLRTAGALAGARPY